MTLLPRSNIIRLLSCLILLAAAPMAMAQTTRTATAPAGEGPDRGSEAVVEDEVRGDNGPAQRRARASATGNRGTEEGAAQRVPRWHSYLPGMFR